MSPYDPRTEQFFTATELSPREWDPTTEDSRPGGPLPDSYLPAGAKRFYDQEASAEWRRLVEAERRDRTELLLLGACLLTLVAGLCAWKPWLRGPVGSALVFVAIIGAAVWARAKLDEFEQRRPEHRLVDALRRLGL